MKKIIALAVMLMMFVMVFSLAGCSKGPREVEASDMIELHRWPATSSLTKNAFRIKHSNENVIVECTIDKGYLLSVEIRGYKKNLITKPNDLITFVSYELGEDGIIDVELPITEVQFADIILKTENNIIGYAVIEASGNDPLNPLTVLKSVLFPKIRGEYQKITDEYIKAAIEDVKN